MTDIITSWDTAAGTGDWVFDPEWPMIWTDQHGEAVVDEAGGLINAIPTPTLQRSDEITTAVLISLFSDAVASDDDTLPDQTGDRRGWWGGSIGSKLWLRQRAKRSATLLTQVRDDIQTVLAWLIEDGVASSVDVTTEYTKPGMLGVQIVIRRGNTSLTLRFANVWDLA
ncbi:phage GP46 family protein [Novosphingobium sp. 9]|uniref:phage GP46 family protein n=1 Tax=Novosphingobium sp. 9 TaxID=2025349 RepID=UPI0021B623D1|nr:phage GP46 family protein [Novosphingobium sp. 9]